MSLDISVILIMLFVIVYVGILKFFSILFRMTGLTKEKAKFQSISLFTAVGYTTKESELISTDRTRRKIATACMITGNVFSVIIVSLIVNLISNFTITEDKQALIVIGIAFGVFLLIMILFQLPFIQKGMSKMIEKAVARTLSKDKKENVLTLLDNYGDEAICEIYINTLPEMLDGKSIFESGIKKDHGINILILKRRGHVITITKDTMIQPHDNIVAFGGYSEIKEVFTNKNKKTEKLPRNVNTVDLIDNYSSQAMATVKLVSIPQIMKDKTLEECQLKALYGINVMMVKRGEDIVEVRRDTKIIEGDEIIVFGPFNNIRYLFTPETLPAENNAA